MQKTRPKTSFWDNLLPHPFVSVLVALSWLMLAHSVSAGNLLMALVLGALDSQIDPALYRAYTRHQLDCGTFIPW